MSKDHRLSSPQVKKFNIQCSIENGEKWYLNSKTADVHFSFDSSDNDKASGTRIPAHKILLADKSDVFEAMFYGELKETGDIRVTDVSDAAFVEFLQFFYNNQVEVSVSMVLTYIIFK